jgi:hypothetical protein
LVYHNNALFLPFGQHNYKRSRKHLDSSFLKILERKNGLGSEKIKLPAGQARKTRCYHPQAPFGVVVVEKFEKRMMNFDEFQ